MNDLKFSIVINTYNREPYLRRLLSGLNRLRDVQFEVIVVNGPSTDGTAALLEQYRGRLKAADCPTRNLSHSRNIGIAAAAGDIVVFIDDDALPGDEDWLTRIHRVFAEDLASEVGVVGGPAFHRDSDQLEYSGGAVSDYGVQIFDMTQIGQRVLDGQRWVRGVRGLNIAFRRQALLKIGGYDGFHPYYLEETNVCLRLARAGYSIVYRPDNPVRHYAGPTHNRTNNYDRNWRSIALSDTYYSLKNGLDRLPVRILKTCILAPRKHFVAEINRYLLNGEISLGHWLRLIGQWGHGFASGLMAGLFKPRDLGDFSKLPQPFLPFPAPLSSRPLRIALLTQTVPGQSSYGGIGRYTFDLASGLHERGHEVHIFCRDDQPLHHESLGFVIHGIPANNARPVDNNRPVLNRNISHSLAIGHKLAELYAQGIEFDVVHASNWDAEAIALIRMEVYPTVMMLVSPLAQVMKVEGWEENDDLQACVALDRWQVTHVDAACVPSNGVLNSYRKLMSITPSDLPDLELTPLGILPDIIQGISLTGHRRRLLFVGRCERRKGIHTLLDVLPDLLTIYPDWECHIVGNDLLPLPEGGTFKEHFLAKYHGADWLSRVIFCGTATEEKLHWHYRCCDLFVAPSLFESFGLIYHEAMQYGKAVVGCLTGGVPEVVEHGIEGLLVAPDNPAELREALSLLMSNETLRCRMGEMGARRVHQRMNYRTMASKMEQVYLKTIAKVGAKRRLHRQFAWRKELPLFTPAKDIKISDGWEIREVTPGQKYLFGQPGNSISLTLPGNSTLWVTALRHPWSGVLEVRSNHKVPHYIDLYKPGELELAYSTSVAIDNKPETETTLTLKVHPEHHPESYASQVWLKQVAVSLLPSKETDVSKSI